MTKFGVSFIVDATKLGHLMEVLMPCKVIDLDFKVVAGTAKRIRAGDKTASQIVGELATDKPQPRKVFTDHMKKAGFANASTGIDQAIRQRQIRRVMVKGMPHYVKEKRK